MTDIGDLIDEAMRGVAVVPCPTCRGTGETLEGRCETCNGCGITTTNELETDDESL